MSIPTTSGGVASELGKGDGRVGKSVREKGVTGGGRRRQGCKGYGSKYVGQQGGAGTARHTPMQ